jgi:hypothetical protein
MASVSVIQKICSNNDHYQTESAGSCSFEFQTLPPRPWTRFGLIYHHLSEHGLWCFPQALLLGEDRYSYKKQPLVPWWELQNRPPTSEEILDWRRRFPHAGAGIPTGRTTGLLVVDADSTDAVEALEMRGMPETVLVRTQRGIHYWLKYPDFDVSNSAGKLGTGIDVRGRGGQVVAAGTHRPDTGFVYNYDRGHALGELPIAEPPNWLLDELRETAARKVTFAPAAEPRTYRGRTSAWARRAFDGNLSMLTHAAPGSRNTAFWDCARRLGQLCGGGELDEIEVLAALCAVADSWPNSTHSRDTIGRALTAGKASPRSAPPPSRSRIALVEVDPGAPLDGIGIFAVKEVALAESASGVQ